MLRIEFTDKIEKAPFTQRMQSIVKPKEHIDLLCLPPKFLQQLLFSDELLGATALLLFRDVHVTEH